jgi:hypothetical protein
MVFDGNTWKIASNFIFFAQFFQTHELFHTFNYRAYSSRDLEVWLWRLAFDSKNNSMCIVFIILDLNPHCYILFI